MAMEDSQGKAVHSHLKAWTKENKYIVGMILKGAFGPTDPERAEDFGWINMLL